MKDAPSHAESRLARLGALASKLAEDDPSTAIPPSVRVIMTVAPVLGFGVILLVGWILRGGATVGFLAAALLLSFIGLGKFVIWGSAIGAMFEGMAAHVDISSWILAGLVVYGDIGTCLVLMANMTLLYRMPVLGRHMATAHESGWYVLHSNPWMRRVAWFGVVGFVAAPFQCTGAVIGTVMSRILGMSRFGTITATVVGSAIGCSLLALLGEYGRSRAAVMGRHPLIVFGIFLATVAVMILLGRWLTGQSNRAQAQLVKDDERPPA